MTSESVTSVKQMAISICEMWTGVCVMVHDKDREGCNSDNCAAYQIAVETCRSLKEALGERSE